MEYYDDPEAKAEILRRMQTTDFQHRMGVHQSDLVFCLNKSALKRTNPVPPREDEILRWGRGIASQRWLTQSLTDETTIELDGIQVTPDALWTDGNPWELKDTDSSSEKPILESLQYIVQIMNQCKVLGKTTARVSRLCNMGNWKWVYRPKDPEKIKVLIEKFGDAWDAHPTLNVTKFVFTQQEIDDNWKRMKRRRDLFLKILDSGKLLVRQVAQLSGLDWECDNCPYKGGLCDCFSTL